MRSTCWIDCPSTARIFSRRSSCNMRVIDSQRRCNANVQLLAMHDFQLLRRARTTATHVAAVARRAAAQARYTQPIDSDQLARSLQPKLQGHSDMQAALAASAIPAAPGHLESAAGAVSAASAGSPFVHTDRRGRFGICIAPPVHYGVMHGHAKEYVSNSQLQLEVLDA